MSDEAWCAVAAAFLARDPRAKCALVMQLATPGQPPSDQWLAPPVEQPGRPGKPVLVHARDVPRRGLGTDQGRSAFLHAVAHIEFNAINLALDAVLRFPDMSDAYRQDWLSVATDEARHYLMLADRMAELGSAYGDYPAHDGLWEAAVSTAGSLSARMAIVPRVLEARGLDVTPGLISRLESAGDSQSAAILRVILDEEVRHVAIGSHWFKWACAERGLVPQEEFLRCVEAYLPGRRFKALNADARLRAGFSEEELHRLAQV